MMSSDLTDEEWAVIRPILPPQRPKTGRPALDHRKVVNAILWVKFNGYPWRDLPAGYGKWSTAASRYHRWVRAGIWNRIVEALNENASETRKRSGMQLSAVQIGAGRVGKANDRVRAESVSGTAQPAMSATIAWREIGGRPSAETRQGM